MKMQWKKSRRWGSWSSSQPVPADRSKAWLEVPALMVEKPSY